MPPVAATVTDPVDAPKMDTFVCELTDNASAAAGWVIVTEAVAVALFASVTVRV